MVWVEIALMAKAGRHMALFLAKAARLERQQSVRGGKLKRTSKESRGGGRLSVTIGVKMTEGFLCQSGCRLAWWSDGAGRC